MHEVVNSRKLAIWDNDVRRAVPNRRPDNEVLSQKSGWGFFFCRFGPHGFSVWGKTLNGLVNEAWLVIVKAEWRGQIPVRVRAGVT